MQPTVLLLNGTSSSGKTTLSRYFQNSKSELWLVASLDSFLEMLPSKMDLDWPPFSQLSRAYYETAAIWVRSGYNLIIDTVIDEQDSLMNCIQCLSDFRVYTIGLHCSQAELLRRAQSRTDRETGLVQRQFDRVHSQMNYDLQLDTSVLSVEQCASQISDMLESLPEPTAFRTLKTQASKGR